MVKREGRGEVGTIRGEKNRRRGKTDEEGNGEIWIRRQKCEGENKEGKGGEAWTK